MHGPNLPSLDLASIRVPSEGPARLVEEFTTTERKEELIRRGCADFSKWEVIVKLSPFLLLLAMGISWKVHDAMQGNLFCLW